MNVCERKPSMEDYKLENAPAAVRRSDTRKPSKPLLRLHSPYQQSHVKRLHRIEQSDETSKEGVLVNTKQKRISEAEQTRAQRTARAKASPTELSSSDFSCSIFNRQFRAKIGFIIHLRTHKQHFMQLIRIGHCQ